MYLDPAVENFTKYPEEDIPEVLAMREHLVNSHSHTVVDERSPKWLEQLHECMELG